MCAEWRDAACPSVLEDIVVMGDTNPMETPPEPALQPVAEPTAEPEAAAEPEPTPVETTPEPPAAYSRPQGKHLYAVLCEAATMEADKGADDAVKMATDRYSQSPSLDCLGPLLKALCPDVTPVEIVHVAAMIAARGEAVGSFPPSSSLPSLERGLHGLKTELLSMQKLRQVFWGLRCTITGTWPTQTPWLESSAHTDENNSGCSCGGEPPWHPVSVRGEPLSRETAFKTDVIILSWHTV